MNATKNKIFLTAQIIYKHILILIKNEPRQTYHVSIRRILTDEQKVEICK